MQEHDLSSQKKFWQMVKLVAENSLNKIELSTHRQENFQKSHHEAVSSLSSLLKEQI